MKRFFKTIKNIFVTCAVSLFLATVALADGKLPVTGDEFNPIILIIAGVAIVGFIAVIILTRPKKKDENDKDNQE